ncbi:MAG: hypothetical protein Q7S05_03235 [bacterium]|nr:hypothetical protein [bacterium]
MFKSLTQVQATTSLVAIAIFVAVTKHGDSQEGAFGSVFLLTIFLTFVAFLGDVEVKMPKEMKENILISMAGILVGALLAGSWAIAGSVVLTGMTLAIAGLALFLVADKYGGGNNVRAGDIWFHLCVQAAMLVLAWFVWMKT